MQQQALQLPAAGSSLAVVQQVMQKWRRQDNAAHGSRHTKARLSVMRNVTQAF
jgi:hypothetical protein